MRSIGVKNINLVKRLTKEAIEKRRMSYGIVESYTGIEAEVVEKLPEKLWDTWEMADQQIRGIIDNVIMDYIQQFETIKKERTRQND